MPQCLLFAVEPLLHSARSVLSKDFSFPDCKLKKEKKKKKLPIMVKVQQLLQTTITCHSGLSESHCLRSNHSGLNFSFTPVLNNP